MSNILTPADYASLLCRSCRGETNGTEQCDACYYADYAARFGDDSDALTIARLSEDVRHADLKLATLRDENERLRTANASLQQALVMALTQAERNAEKLAEVRRDFVSQLEMLEEDFRLKLEIVDEGRAKTTSATGIARCVVCCDLFDRDLTSCPRCVQAGRR